MKGIFELAVCCGGGFYKPPCCEKTYIIPG
uniref:Uncharacterized protein n=1 Tax=Rhodnius prolixus TaxID=13249 RepID=A0A905QX06_RHOPR